MNAPDPGPSWPLRPVALFALFVAALVFSVNLSVETELQETVGYLMLLVVGPFAAGLIWSLCDRGGEEAWKLAAGRVVLLAAATLLLLSIGGLTHQNDQLYHWTNDKLGQYVPFFREIHFRLPLHDQLVDFLAAFLVLSMVALAGRLPGPVARPLDRLAVWSVPLLVGALVLFAAVYTPLYPARDDRVSAFLGWAVDRPLFPILILAAWPLAWLLPRLPAVRGGPIAALLLAVALVFALLLYDDQSFIEWAHYTAYVGPALHALHGGVPMVEVYSQYGLLPWALLTTAYHWLPQTYGSAAMIVRFVTVLWYLSLPLTVYRLVAHKPAALLLASVGLLWIICFHIYALNMNALPSTQGYRYLLPSLAVAWLAWVPEGRRRDLGLFLLALVGSLWSIEATAYVAGPPIAFALLTAVCDRSLLPFARTLLTVVAGIAVGHAGLAAFLQITYGRWPDYGPMLGGLAFFEPRQDGQHSLWSEPIPYGFGLWMPMAGIFFVALAMPVRDALAGRIRHPRAWSLVPASVLGIGELSYFVGRSHATTLGLALMPFLTVAIVGIDALVERWRRAPARTLRAERLLVALAIAGCAAFAMERFLRPYDPGKTNASILRHCFTEAGCAPATVVRRIVDATKEKAADLDLADPKNALVAKNEFLARVREAERLVEAYAPDQERVGLLVDTGNYSFVGVPTLADLDKWYAWPINSPVNDGQTPAVARRIVASARPSDGEILIIDKKRDELADVVRPLAEKYAAHCRLERIDAGRFFEVVRTSDCHD
ncbi:hypothetical protein SAMN06265365_107221 [Tistlia consotensis]|uniref:Uncharacterized protein n=1 Tax=Tistlia consotensis USBA 355 TaxID=560819 RepID=A0A1Y6BFL9_9PROT|nr:hypothetical protein [Tistlia consotensis]SME98915.1 hypothetical protein SAMN05428998_102223 [Tistlia consotensis USBA 355]SNR58391.1 hypothetical protein SAMN06265365_107221 [Tistlia consotensis]